jgi:hypothetical protein
MRTQATAQFAFLGSLGGLASLTPSAHGKFTGKPLATSRVAPSSKMRPNPSIERTNSGLRPPLAAHVKR